MAHQQILCSVHSCYYYDTGNLCRAAKIMVQNNPQTIKNAGMEIGEMGSQADVSNHTLCQTFIPKEKGPKPGIERIS